jgi:hypothetical protein
MILSSVLSTEEFLRLKPARPLKIVNFGISEDLSDWITTSVLQLENVSFRVADLLKLLVNMRIGAKKD